MWNSAEYLGGCVEQRSESEVVLKILRLTFGGKEYEVPVLRRKQSAEWRKLFFERTQEVAESMPMNFTGESSQLSKAIARSLTGGILRFPEKIPDLVFAYAVSLTEEQKTEILEKAYDQE